nr:class I SAM-dependent methyltransferase [uncultured Methanobrevibacter sp.]
MSDNEFKHKHELKFWSDRVKDEKILENSAYEKFYIHDLKLSHEEFEDKAILDIGCGPRGSLEWADMARLRIGIDPLVNEYYKLNGGTLFHKMHYVRAYSEDMPFPDEMFDFIFSINSLDHVDDLDETISEIKRVLKIGGICGIIVDANHKPQKTEPITIGLDLKDKFSDVFEVIDERIYETVYNTGFRDNLDDPTFYNLDDEKIRPAILLLKLRKIKPYDVLPDLTIKKDADSFNELFNHNIKLEKENLKLKKEIKAFKNRKVVKFVDRLKNFQ